MKYELIIPLVVPIIIAALKALWPAIPKVWLPIVAPILGALAEILLYLAGMGGGDPAMGALLGQAGVGLREIYDQIKKTIGGNTTD